MFKAKGVCTLRRINTLTGKVEEEITKENVFTTYGMRRAMKLDSIPSPFPVYNYLMISQQTTTPSKGNEVVGQLVGDADSNALIPNPNIWVEASEALPMYGEIRRRLDFQGQPRTFQTILVGDRDARNAPGYPKASNFNNWNTSARAGTGTLKSIPAYCYLLLDSPVTQGSFDIIDIFYRVYFIPANGNGIPKNSELVRNIGRRLFGFTTIQPGSATSVYTSPCSITNAEDYNFIANTTVDDGRVLATFNPVELLFGATYSYSEASMNYFTNSTSLSMLTGRLIRSGSFGSLEGNEFALTARDFLDPTRTPIQTSWAKREGGLPFFNENDFSIGQGRIIPSIPVEWEQQYPDFYRILITKSGEIGNAEYKFERQRFVSYARNTWIPIAAPVFHTGGVPYDFKPAFLPNSYGTDQKTKLELIGEDTLVFWSSRGITILNVLDSTYIKVLGSDTPVVNPLDKLDTTDIRQIAIKDELIYIACAETGIWVVDSSKVEGEAGYVSHPVSSPAYAIATASYQGVLDVYAVLDSGITFEGSNWVTIFTPNCPRIDLYGFNSIATMSGNTNHVDGQIALLSLISGESQIIWWSRALGNGTMVEGEKRIAETSLDWLDGTPGSIQCSESADYFAFAYARSDGFAVRQFGKAVFNQTDVTPVGFLNLSILKSGELVIPARDGNRFFCFNNSNFNSNFSPQLSGNVFAFDENTESRENSLPDFSASYPTMSRYRVGGMAIGGNSSFYDGRTLGFRILHLGRGLYYYAGFLLTPFSEEWEQYGWNGTEWEKDFEGSKVVHDAAEELLDGINIAFSDRGQPNPFFATDFYTLPIAYGALGDNAKTITASLKVLASDLRFQVAFPAGASTITVPNANPYQVTVPGAAEGGFTGMVITDSSTIKVVLDGELLPFNQVLTDGSTPPSPKFVSVNLSTGVLTFHPSDAGKEISGYYSYNLEL